MFTKASSHNALLYHSAADIHIDSYPINSILCLLESILDGGAAIGFCPFKARPDLHFCTDYGSSDQSTETFMNTLRQLVNNINYLHSLQKIANNSMTS